jgi:hypothetical protein
VVYNQSSNPSEKAVSHGFETSSFHSFFVYGRSLRAVIPGSVEAGPAWDTPTVIASSTNQIWGKPALDASGNAWVLLLDQFNNTLSVAGSNGTSGTWGSPQFVTNIPSGAGAVAAALAVTPAGQVHVLYLLEGVQPNQLRDFVYTPGIGWQGPSPIDSIPYAVADATVDSLGNVVAVLVSGQAIVYSAAAGTWGPAQQIIPQGLFSTSATLVRSPDHSKVLLAYLNNGGDQTKGIYSQEYVSSTQTWQAPQYVPNTQNAVNTAGNHYSLAVDNSGNGTLLTTLASAREARGCKALIVLDGYRYEGGKWNRGGWDQETVATASGVESPITAAFFGFSGEAVVTYGQFLDQSNIGINSEIYANGSWSIGAPIAWPGGQAYSSQMAEAPTGEVLLVFSSSTGGGLLTEATWLRP